MKLKPGVAAEYHRRHNQIWPELLKLLKDNGIARYSIFHDPETDILFAVQEIEGNRNSQELGREEIVQRWWAYMADLMETNQDNSPVSLPLEPMFFLE